MMKKISLALCLSALVASAPINTFASERAPDYVHHNMYKQENNVVMYEKSVVCAPGTGPATPSPSGGGGESSGSSGAVAADSTGAQVYNYLLGKGLSPVQALGIIGNLMQESGNKTLNLSTSASNGPSIGIAQWEGSRRYGSTTSSLQGFAASQGKPMTDLGVQMDFMWHELNTTYKKNTLDPILASTTLEQSTSIFLNQYERPRVRDLQNRLNLANTAAQQLGVDIGSATATQPTAPAASAVTTSPSTTVNCAPQGGGGGGGSGDGGTGGSAPTKPTGENGKLDLSQLARVTIACSGSWSEPYLTVEASAALTQLNAAFKQKFGRDMHGISCYRSYDKQVEAKAYWTAQGKPGNAATPGTSNHGWGLAIDLQAKPGTSMTYGSAEYKWLMQNAGAYGYCNPKNMQQGGSGPAEPWHWQYKQGC